jgi:hypothetical protein
MHLEKARRSLLDMADQIAALRCLKAFDVDPLPWNQLEEDIRRAANCATSEGMLEAVEDLARYYLPEFARYATHLQPIATVIRLLRMARCRPPGAAASGVWHKILGRGP